MGNEVNTITPAYTAQPSLKVQKTNIGTQKIDGSTFETFEIVIADFQIENMLGRVQFCQKTFLIVNITLEVIFKILFFTLSNVDIQFAKGELTWRSYTIKEA